MGVDSHHWLIANLSVATGIAPSVLLNETDRMLNTMLFALQYQRSGEDG